MLSAAIHGFILAFSLILPLGAQNVFVFNQGVLQPRFIKAMPVVITAAVCDTILISLAVLGISLVVLSSPLIKTLLLSFGVIFLLYMGWVTWRASPGKLEQEGPITLSPGKQVLFAASVSLLNPHAILDTIGVIGTSSLNYQGIDRAAFSVSTIFVSWIWFIGLAILGRLTGRMDRTGRLVRLLNKISAVIMWVAASFLVYSLIK